MAKPLLSVVFCLLATPALAQVEVGIRTEKTAYRAGEPVFILVDIKNVGDEPISYDGGGIQNPLTFVVANGTPKPVRSLSPCGGIGGGEAIGIVGHPPMLKPGAQTTRRYLLRGYRLTPGSYELRVSGHADVRWKYYPSLPSGAPAPPPKHKDGDPVEGAVVDRTVPLLIVAGSQSELEAAYKPYVAVAMELYSRQGFEAAQALFEMAPAFLEAEIVKVVRYAGNQDGIAASAAAALAEIDSPSSRRELIAWFDRSRDLQIRRAIVDAIAKSRHPDNLEFLASLLPGRSTEMDDWIRSTAAFGIGRIGGPAAVSALAQAPSSPNPLVNGNIIRALGNTHDKSAVPVLIDRARGRNGWVDNEVCNALPALTHRQWCDGSADVSAMQERWRRWWAANGATATIYDNEDCPTLNELPFIR
jgi:HEAT repeats